MKQLIIVTALSCSVSAFAGSGEVWSEPSGVSTIAVGLGNGAFGGLFTQDLRLKLTFMEHFGVVVRPMIMHSLGAGRIDVGGHLGVFGQTDAMLNILRLYGGGGATFLVPVADGVESKLRPGFGGHFGIEGFLNESYSFYFEVGGHGFFDETLGSGASVMAGMLFYL